jgi:hypothetical protein
MQRLNSKGKYEGQALAIAMVILVVSSLIGLSIYSRSMKDKSLTLEERASAEALEVADVILDKLTQYPINRVIQVIEGLEIAETIDYTTGIVLEENESENKAEITGLLTGLGALSTETISDLIDPLCPLSIGNNIYQVTLKESDPTAYYEIRPGHVWSLPVRNVLGSGEICISQFRFAIRGDTTAGFVLIKVYCDHDESGNVSDCKEYEYQDIENYCFSTGANRGSICNNSNFSDTANWILHDPDDPITPVEVEIPMTPTPPTEEPPEEPPPPEEPEYSPAEEFGTGNDGPCVVNNGTKRLNSTAGTSMCVGSSRISPYAVNFLVSINIPAGSQSINMGTSGGTVGLEAGDEIMIINLQGVSGNSSNVGKYETAHILSKGGNILNLDKALENRYDGTTQRIMLQRIPNFTDMTICGGNTGGGCTAAAVLATESFSGRNGVIAFRATGSVIVKSGGVINGNSLGYAGGANATNLDSVRSKPGESTFRSSSVSGQGGLGVSATASKAGQNGEYSGGGGGGAYRTTALGTGGLGSTTSGAGGGGGGGSAASRNTSTTVPGDGSGGGGGGGGYGTGGQVGTGGAQVGTIASSGAGSPATLSGGSTPNNVGGAGGGGAIYGDSNLTKLYFGSGGGGAGCGQTNGGQNTQCGSRGGRGGGIIFIGTRTLQLEATGYIRANGENSPNVTVNLGGSGGGGAGGSIKIIAGPGTIESSRITANAGSSGTVLMGRRGGSGGSGRIYIKQYTAEELETPVTPPSDPGSGDEDDDTPGSGDTPGLGEDTRKLSEIRIKAVGGTIGVRYSLSEGCFMNGGKMYSLRATATCSGAYRGKEVIIPESKWYNVLFDYILFNGEGSI